jgi:hypothetical protein
MSNILYLNQSARDLASAARTREVWAQEWAAKGAHHRAHVYRLIAREYLATAKGYARMAGLPMPGQNKAPCDELPKLIMIPVPDLGMSFFSRSGDARNP